MMIITHPLFHPDFQPTFSTNLLPDGQRHGVSLHVGGYWCRPLLGGLLSAALTTSKEEEKVAGGNGKD